MSANSLTSAPTRIVDSVTPGHARIAGRDKIVLSVNDYLGLASDPRVVEAANEASRRFGFGARASRRLGGTTALHRQLEIELADFKGTEDALVFSSGYACNTGTIQAMVGPGDLIVSDELNHASIVDGCRLSRATVTTYRHLDPDDAAERLAQKADGKKWLVTDSIFSMNGDLAPLNDLFEVAKRHGSSVMVDDAHATGVFGPGGEGSLAHFGLTGSADLVIGTLGKALGSMGGFVAANRDVIELISGRARTFLFTTAAPAAVAAASLAALRILRQEPQLVTRLWANATRLHAGLTALGFSVANVARPILPIDFRNQTTADALCNLLFDQDVVVHAVGPPYVPNGTSRVRAIVSAAHSDEDITKVLDAFESGTALLRG